MSVDAAALRSSLDELSGLLESDIRMIVDPQADADGNILHQDRLMAFTTRAARTARRLVEVTAPSEALGEANEVLARIRTVADSIVPLAESAARVAETAPETVEDFFIPLGPVLKELEAGRERLLELTASMKSRLK